jgi:DNA-binding XRE family transcriptional regulator
MRPGGLVVKAGETRSSEVSRWLTGGRGAIVFQAMTQSPEGSPSALRAVREAKGLSLDAAARAAGIDKAHLSRIERGLKRPSLRTLQALGRVLGLRNIIALFDEEPG